MAKTRKPLPPMTRCMLTRIVHYPRSDTLEGRCPQCGIWQDIEEQTFRFDGLIWFVCMEPARRCQCEGPMRLLCQP